MKKFLTANGGILAIFAAVIVVAGAYGEWRIATNVDAAMTKAGHVKRYEVMAVAKDIEKLENLKTTTGGKSFFFLKMF